VLENLPNGGCVARIRMPFQLTADDRAELVMPAPADVSAAPLAAAGD
jgi:hypothetical protein